MSDPSGPTANWICAHFLQSDVLKSSILGLEREGIKNLANFPIWKKYSSDRKDHIGASKSG